MSDKSNIEIIKEYIETCPLLKNGKINVDYLKDKPQSYSIDITPNNPIYKEYKDGTKLKQITFDFTVQAPLSTQVIVNLANSKFCEDFMNWIEVKNREEILPNIIGIQWIKCTSPGYILGKTETTAIYIIQMQVVYRQEAI